ncbi:peptidoglycan DD-metalloendopeptidase family protein [Candidatus Oleimmundimicrobium sp.]|uniref:murein hydrolase activator EnvC family protein n=1 Tax=Candidatus Oleimmundimicrobium sp. TaxID=3060597 RepID=UPI002716B11B|nr:peptidoglycan DD-metalloendopeptidase family protein [Candidatus Oleimmundimicrobium sp.]MDO8885698.1 peptidoglycan DD-metalloendopeptidase family protein [Candidatus Oleimmundimicrobium sp.]
MLQISRKNSIFTIFLTVIIIILFVNPVLSSPIDEAEDEFKSINEQIEENRKKIEETKEEGSALSREISGIDHKLQLSEDQLVKISEQLNFTIEKYEEVEDGLKLTQKELQKTEYELEELKNELVRQNGILDTRIRNIYKQGDLVYLEVALNASDFSDLLKRLSFFYSIVNQDATLLFKIDLTRKNTNEKKVKIESQKKEIEGQLEILKQEELRLESLKIAGENRKKEIRSEINNKKRVLDKISLDEAALKQVEKELEKSSQEIADYIRRLEDGENSTGPIGLFQWPTVGPVTSGFGMRWHPVYHVYLMHNGIDIGAPYGQKIIAAQSGTVLFADWKTGYGRTLIISHGGGISTLYAHTSAIYVREGQKVEKGQKVAAIGVTGVSTGPHLHFEVRVNGEPKNPMNWF